MISVNPYIRVTKIFNSNMYMLNCSTNKSICREIGKTYLNLLTDSNVETGANKVEMEKKYSKKLIDELLEEGTLVNTENPRYNHNILEKLNHVYPLTGVVIELTNACNLNCVHCYGQFGRPKTCQQWSLKDVKELKSQLDELHTAEVRLSGGECFLNPDFEEIALFFLDNGFRVGIYTNGSLPDALEHFLKRTRNYNYYIAVSLDGICDMHNIMRGHDCYNNVIKSLDILKMYDNVEVLIETAVSKINLKNVVETREFVKREYPKFEHKSFFISPIENAEISFSSQEIRDLSHEYDYLFENYLKRHSAKRFLCFGEKRRRCYGGVINGVITADRNVKCCPIAQDEDFVMGNALERDLVSIWETPDKETPEFRNEYIRNSTKCKKCMYRRKCGDANCRVEAKALTGDWRNDSPYTCSALEHMEGK